MKRLTVSVLLLFVAMAANAQSDKSRTWEWSIAALYQESKNIDGANGSSLNVDDAFGIGFNIGYNFSDHLTVGMDIDFLKPDYLAVLVDDTVIPNETTIIDHDLTQYNFRFKATYNFLEGPFRPFVEAGLGWSYFDSNVADGPPLVGCYWHPYWGYICNGFYNTFDETSFTYGAGVGFKYQFVGDSFLKLSYNVWEIDDIGNSDASNMTGARLEYGWNF